MFLPSVNNFLKFRAMARPKKAIKRTHRIKARFTTGEFKIIQRYASSQGIPMSEFVRAKTLDHRLKSRLSDQEADLFHQLVDMASSLRQLSQQTSERKLMTLQIIKTLDGVNELIEKIQVTMIGKTNIGKTFGGCVHYVMEKDRAEVLDEKGVRRQNAIVATQDFNRIRSQNPRIQNAVCAYLYFVCL